MDAHVAALDVTGDGAPRCRSDAVASRGSSVPTCTRLSLARLHDRRVPRRSRRGAELELWCRVHARVPARGARASQARVAASARGSPLSPHEEATRHVAAWRPAAGRGASSPTDTVRPRTAVRCSASPTRSSPAIRRTRSSPPTTFRSTPTSVFNPGATIVESGETLLLVRVEDRRGLSQLHVAAIERTASRGWRVEPKPLLSPEPGSVASAWGYEDPRLVHCPGARRLGDHVHGVRSRWPVRLPRVDERLRDARSPQRGDAAGGQERGGVPAPHRRLLVLAAPSGRHGERLGRDLAVALRGPRVVAFPGASDDLPPRWLVGPRPHRHRTTADRDARGLAARVPRRAADDERRALPRRRRAARPRRSCTVSAHGPTTGCSSPTAPYERVGDVPERGVPVRGRRGRRHAASVLRRRRHVHRSGNGQGRRILLDLLLNSEPVHAPGSPIGGRRGSPGTWRSVPRQSVSLLRLRAIGLREWRWADAGRGSHPAREAAPAPAEPESAPAPRAAVARRVLRVGDAHGPQPQTRTSGRTSACVESTVVRRQERGEQRERADREEHPTERAFGVEVSDAGRRSRRARRCRPRRRARR